MRKQNKNSHLVWVQIQRASLFPTAEWRRKEQLPPPLSLPCLHYAGKVSTVPGSTFEIAAEVWLCVPWLQEERQTDIKQKRGVQVHPKAPLLLLHSPEEEKAPVSFSTSSMQSLLAPAPNTWPPCWIIACAGNCKAQGNFIFFLAKSLYTYKRDIIFF